MRPKPPIDHITSFSFDEDAAPRPGAIAVGRAELVALWERLTVEQRAWVIQAMRAFVAEET